jgi:thiamine biosynthesis protein ThiI
MVKSTALFLCHKLVQLGAGFEIIQFDSVIVRFSGEIGIKSEWTRRAYEKLLLKNLYNALKHHDVAYEKIVRKRGRIYIETKNAEEAASILTHIFGISSVSPAIKTTSDIEKTVQTSVRMAEATIKNECSFAVRCHRVGTHVYSSMDVCTEVGERILEKLKDKNLHVNLADPQFTISIEVRDAEAYVFAEILHGAGGFPVSSQAKVVCLLSGGIDSPVACWLAMKRGCTIVPVYLDNAPLTDEMTRAKALDTARRLFEWSIGYPRKVYVVPHGKTLETFVREAPRKLTCILCKRMMYRIAERIAEIEKAEGIVTGEAIGEQASQTLTNLRVLDEAAMKYPIHRPLLGFDKTETETLAKKIGTFEISTRKAKGCSAAPSKPATMAKLNIVRTAEEKLDIEKMVNESVKAAKIITV